MFDASTSFPDLSQIELWDAEASKRLARAVAESIAAERRRGIDANGVPFSKPGIDMHDHGSMLRTFVESAAQATAEGVALRSSARWGQPGEGEPDWSREGRYVWAGISPTNHAESQEPMMRAAAAALEASVRRLQARSVSTEGGTVAATDAPIIEGT